MRNGTDHIERWRLKFADRLKHSLCLLERTGITPHDATHFFVVQVFGKRRAWRNGEESEKAIKAIRCLGYKASIPSKDFRRIFHWPQHWARIVRVNRMCLEEKGCDNTKITASAAHCPEKVRVFIGTSCNKASVSQNHVHSQKITNSKTALPR